jgi:hypothetical protein
MLRPELKKVNCPFMRAMFNAPDAPKWDPQAQEMNVEDLIRFARDQPGDGNLDKVLRFFSVINHGLGNRIQRLGMLVLGSGGRFSTVLRGSDGDHEGDSRIYNPDTGEFDPEQFQHFTSFSKDGTTMGIAEVGAAIADSNKRHNGTPMTAVQSAGEFGLLSLLLGDDSGTFKIDDMRRLFEANEFPEGAREHLGTRTADHWMKLTRKITAAISAAAVRAHSDEREMRADRLKRSMEILFSPLIKILASRR